MWQNLNRIRLCFSLREGWVALRSNDLVFFIIGLIALKERVDVILCLSVFFKYPPNGLADSKVF